jgi:hypothetical protein
MYKKKKNTIESKKDAVVENIEENKKLYEYLDQLDSESIKISEDKKIYIKQIDQLEDLIIELLWENYSDPIKKMQELKNKEKSLLIDGILAKLNSQIK